MPSKRIWSHISLLWEARNALTSLQGSDKYSHGTAHYGFADIDKRKQHLPANTTSQGQK